MDSTVWYKRLAEVPGLDFGGSPGVDRRRLRGHDARPTVVKLSLSDPDREILTWPQAAWTSSWSPAQEHFAGGDATMLDVTALVRRTWEAIELPGDVFAYHLGLQTTVTTLWAKHRQDLDALAHLEVFARLDLGLLAAQQSEFLIDRAQSPNRYADVSTFAPLLTILEREGAWREALEFAELAVGIGQQELRRDRLAERVAALNQETA